MEQKAALVIDPLHDISEKLSQILKVPEWSVQEVANNSEALDVVRSKKFDLILTSVRSSGKEDVELLRVMRRLHPHVRVIILTDDTMPDDIQEAIRAGAFSYFTQPFSLPALAEMVTHATQEPYWDDGIEIVSAAPKWVRLIARCDKKTADRLLQFVQEMIDLPSHERETVGWALGELLMNAVEHGGNFRPDQYVELSYIRTKRAVACRVKDPGEGFSFDEISHAAVSNPSNDPLRHLNYREAGNLRPGGFGILLARNMVDELAYNEQGNEVLLIRYVDGL